MNDPEIADEPQSLKEIHAIRLMIYDDIKDMSADEVKAYYKKELDKALSKYKFKVVANTK